MIATSEKSLTTTSKHASRTAIHRGDVDSQILNALSEHSSGSMCIGSSTGEIHGIAGRVAALREQGGISMCFWGGFVK